uniref:Venom protein n=1 Tax=Panagrellus redivivus TaxID=6233 RepID=A0A7E4VG55_PANRE
MAKTTVIVVVAAFCAFVVGEPALRVCKDEGWCPKDCMDVETVQPVCNIIRMDWNDVAMSVETFGRCMKVYEHINCEGAHYEVGSTKAKNNNCTHFFSKCGFGKMMTTFKPC